MEEKSEMERIPETEMKPETEVKPEAEMKPEAETKAEAETKPDENRTETGLRTIEVMLSRDKSPFSWLTYFADGGGLTHASIALDENAEFYYSFNFKGFKKEYKTSLKKRPREMVRYKIAVTQEQYEALKRMIAEMEADKGKYKYAKAGVMMCLLKLPNADPSEEKLFCSQFVAKLLDESGAVKMEELPSEITPNDLGFELGKSGKVTDVSVESDLKMPAGQLLDAAMEGVEKGKNLVIDFTADRMKKAEEADPFLPEFVLKIGTGTIEKAETVYEAAATLSKKAKDFADGLPGALADKTGGLLEKASGLLEKAAGAGFGAGKKDKQDKKEE